ncbi:hypothetical protein D3C80_2019520 [compost metagenome]
MIERLERLFLALDGMDLGDARKPQRESPRPREEIGHALCLAHMPEDQGCHGILCFLRRLHEGARRR